MKTLTDREIESIYRKAEQDGRIPEQATAVIFHSHEILSDRLNALKQAFPGDTLHAVAVKANASPEVLSAIAGAGFGLEAASFEEVELAAAAGVPAQRIVFDSPVKTRSEILACHERFPGMTVNANCLEELERYPEDFSGRLGLRINPLVSSDAPAMWNVSGRESKFGVDIRRSDDIINAALEFPEISGLHLHVGSGIKDTRANVEAIGKVADLARSINERRTANDQQPLHWMDIGGGILFEDMEGPYGLQRYVDRIRSETGLFGDFEVITEFGKFVHNDAGFVVSDIEYVTPGYETGDPATAFIHVGADLFVRKVYSDLPIEFPCTVLKAPGNDSTRTMRYNVAGPLCFAGDFLYRDIELPELEEGDRLVIRNTGANTLSMWSRHCSRKIPPMLMV